MLALFTNFRNALAFLSRMVPPASFDEAALGRAVPYYPLVGLVLGMAAVIPALLFAGVLPAVSSWLQAWLYVVILAWLTRGLHWDGLADLADACGSNAHGETFWKIIKDSRIGAFGVMALVFGISAQVIAVQGCLENARYGLLAFAPAYGRCLVLVFGRVTTPNPRSTLAALVQPGMRTVTALVSLILTLAAALYIFTPATFLVCVLFTLPCVFIAARIAAQHGGCNGDFYGTVVLGSETAALIAGSVL